MKKTLATLALTGLAGAAFAQGTVNWTGVAGTFIGTTNSTVYSTFVPSSGNPTGGSSGSTVSSSTTQYYYELLVSSSATTAPTTLSGLSAWLDTGLEMENGA